MESPPKSPSLLDLLNHSSEHLTELGISSPRLNVEMLLGQTLQVDRTALYLETDRMLSADELERFQAVLRRRIALEPLQYILGQTEFMSLPFTVQPGVLIPRPETEILVETTIEHLSRGAFRQKEQISLLDVGTGSGCIAVALARSLRNAKILALDISAVALEVAALNAEQNKVHAQINFAQTDILSQNVCLRLDSLFDVIVSNPPYVSKSEYLSLPQEIKKYEPETALTDRADGLTYYKRLAAFCRDHLQPSGFVALEVGMGQAPAVKEILCKKGLTQVTTYPDLNGIVRVVIGRI